MSKMQTRERNGIRGKHGLNVLKMILGLPCGGEQVEEHGRKRGGELEGSCSHLGKKEEASFSKVLLKAQVGGGQMDCQSWHNAGHQ